MLTEAKMRALTKGLPSKSAKMRALAKAGVARADIARFLGTRYQFVRNVLEAENAKTTGFAESPQSEYKSQPGERGSGSREEPQTFRLRVHDGTAALPPNALSLIGATEGDTLVVKIEENGIDLRIWSLQAALRLIQAQSRSLVQEGISVVDEFLAEKYREVEREERGE